VGTLRFAYEVPYNRNGHGSTFMRALDPRIHPSRQKCFALDGLPDQAGDDGSRKGDYITIKNALGSFGTRVKVDG